RLVKIERHNSTSIAGRNFSFSRRIRMNYCVKPVTVEFYGSTNNRTGFVKDNRIRVLTSSVIVAENNIVCLDFGNDSVISVNSSRNPSSNILLSTINLKKVY